MEYDIKHFNFSLRPNKNQSGNHGERFSCSFKMIECWDANACWKQGRCNNKEDKYRGPKYTFRFVQVLYMNNVVVVGGVFFSRSSLHSCYSCADIFCLAFVKHLKTLRPLSSWLEMLSYWFALRFDIILPSNFLPALVSFLFCFILKFVFRFVFHFISSFVFVSTFFPVAIFLRLSLIAFNTRLKSLNGILFCRLVPYTHTHTVYLAQYSWCLFYKFACNFAICAILPIFFGYFQSDLFARNPFRESLILKSFLTTLFERSMEYFNFGLDFFFLFSSCGTFCQQSVQSICSHDMIFIYKKFHFIDHTTVFLNRCQSHVVVVVYAEIVAARVSTLWCEIQLNNASLSSMLGDAWFKTRSLDDSIEIGFFPSYLLLFLLPSSYFNKIVFASFAILHHPLGALAMKLLMVFVCVFVYRLWNAWICMKFICTSRVWLHHKMLKIT